LSEIVVSNGQSMIVASPTAPQRYEDLRLMVEAMSRSGFFKQATDYDRAITLALVGQELGIPPATSIMGIHIIEGKPTMSANLMATQLKKSGKYNYRVRENTAKVCRVAFFEIAAGKSEEVGVSEFTIEEAQAAGLATKQVWRQYPKAMLFARALSQGVRTFCPDAFGGAPVYYDGEIEESFPSDPVKEKKPEPPAKVTEPALAHGGCQITKEETRALNAAYRAKGGDPQELYVRVYNEGLRGFKQIQQFISMLPDPKAAKPVSTSDWASNDNGYAVFGYTLAGFPTMGALTTADGLDDAWQALERVGFPKDTTGAVADAIFDDCELAEEYRCSIGHTLIVLDFAANATREQHAAALEEADAFAVRGHVLQEGLGV